jgi:hypothetical protein
MARFPNFDIDARHWSGVSGDATSEARIRSWANPIGGYLHAMHRAMWGNFHYRITGKDDKGDLILEGGWQNNCQMGTHQHYRFVEGIREELDTPGEWWQDPETSEVLWIPDFEGGRLKAEGGNGEGTPDLNLNVNVNLNEASSAAASVDTPAKHTARDALECASYSPYPRECVVTDCLIYDIGQWRSSRPVSKSQWRWTSPFRIAASTRPRGRESMCRRGPLAAILSSTTMSSIPSARLGTMAASIPGAAVASGIARSAYNCQVGGRKPVVWIIDGR